VVKEKKSKTRSKIPKNLVGINLLTLIKRSQQHQHHGLTISLNLRIDIQILDKKKSIADQIRSLLVKRVVTIGSKRTKLLATKLAVNHEDMDNLMEHAEMMLLVALRDEKNLSTEMIHTHVDIKKIHIHVDTEMKDISDPTTDEIMIGTKGETIGVTTTDEMIGEKTRETSIENMKRNLSQIGLLLLLMLEISPSKSKTTS